MAAPPLLKTSHGSPLFSARRSINSLSLKFLSGTLQSASHLALYGPETPKCLVSFACMLPSQLSSPSPWWPGIPLTPSFPSCEPLFSSQISLRHYRLWEALGVPGLGLHSQALTSQCTAWWRVGAQRTCVEQPRSVDTGGRAESIPDRVIAERQTCSGRLSQGVEKVDGGEAAGGPLLPPCPLL